MEKNKYLLKIESESREFTWIDEQAGFNEDGLVYSSYYNNGKGLVTLREALDYKDKQSIPWLFDEMNRLKKGEIL